MSKVQSLSHTKWECKYHLTWIPKCRRKELLNARDAMDQGGVLSVAADFESPPWVTIRISDTGTGIKPEDVQKIFTPLFTTKEEGKGTGLGLSITQDIIKRHNGTIEVESLPGKGTTFIIRLPSANHSS